MEVMPLAALPDTTKYNPPVFFEKRVSLSKVTYYRIGGEALYFAKPKNMGELAQTIAFAQNHLLPFCVLGSGSNSVFSDELFPGVVICLQNLSHCFWEQKDVLYAQAGVCNTEIAELALEKGYGDAAWMFRMPGLLGASIRMNAKCYTGETSQLVIQVQTMDEAGNLQLYEGSQVFEGYKKTLLMRKPEVVVAARLKFANRKDRVQILQAMLAHEEDRHRKHHFDYPSCGSTFKNNYAIGKPSGAIFDELGMKGKQEGACEVSVFHGNFVWNKGSASAQNMLGLASEMRRAALLKGYDLELEVQPIGMFSQDLFETLAMERLTGNSFKQSEKVLVGCSWFPAKGNTTPKENTARPLFSFASVPLHYHRAPYQGLPGVTVTLSQTKTLQAAQQQPATPFLRWATEIKLVNLPDFLKNPCPLPSDSFVPELWHFSVSELFLANPAWLQANGTTSSSPMQYLEFELTPDLHWLALEFSHRRLRTQSSLVPQPSNWHEIRRFSLNTEDSLIFGMEFSLDILKRLGYTKVTHEGHVSVLFQCCLSLGNNQFYLAPHWENPGSFSTYDYENTPANLPDFHQPSKYSLALLT